MKLSLYNPLKHRFIVQQFGANPGYYSRFKDKFGNPYQGHMGQDWSASHGTPVYAPHDGTAVFKHDDHGGEGIYLQTDVPYDSAQGQSWFTIVLWHLVGDTDPNFPSPVPTNGAYFKVKAGDLIGYADNTGTPFESSGDHFHLGLFPCNNLGTAALPANGEGGCIDPLPYLNGYFAGDASLVTSLIIQLIAIKSALFAKLTAKST